MKSDEVQAKVKALPDEIFLLPGAIYYECCCNLFEVYVVRGDDSQLTPSEHLVKLDAEPQKPVFATEWSET